jgi:hypothetical protein
VAPYYDFDLHFEAKLAPLSYATFTITPMDNVHHCGGGDMERLTGRVMERGRVVRHGTASFTEHQPTWPPHARQPQRAFDSMVASVVAEQQAMLVGETASSAAGFTGTGVSGRQQSADNPEMVVMENRFLKVYIDTSVGIQAVFDKGSGKNYSFTHQMLEYKSLVNNAYDFKPAGAAQPLGSASAAAATSSDFPQCFERSCASGKSCAFSLKPNDSCGPSLCLGWKQTAGCDAMGQLQPEDDKSCSAVIDAVTSGFCECVGKTVPFSCDCGRGNPITKGCGGGRKPFTCHEVCGGSKAPRGQNNSTSSTRRPPPPPPPPGKLWASSVSLGQVMQEVRFQLSSEHKTRVRLWVSDDPAVGGRIELGHRIGVLDEKTEVTSRFTVRELAGAEFYSEDNGYETIRHSSGSGATDINLHHFPSQMSTYITDGTDQLSVALEHGHGVASLYNGSLDVVQHRRGGPFEGHGGTVVIDDTDRIFTHTWVSIGNVSRSNELRHSNKLRLNHPLMVMFGCDPASPGCKPPTSFKKVDPVASKFGSAGGEGLPKPVHLQSVRATSENATEVLLRLLHVYGSTEQPAAASKAVSVDLGKLLAPFEGIGSAAAAKGFTHFNETILNGMIPASSLKRLKWKTVASQDETAGPDSSAERQIRRHSDTELSISPFEFRTFLLSA